LELSEECNVQIKLRLENKKKNVPYVRGQSSSIVTTVDVNVNNNNNTNNNNNNVNDEDFVTSTSSSSDSSNNVVSITTPSYVPPEITIPSNAFSPVPFEEGFATSPQSSMFDDDDEAAVRYQDLISGRNKQNDK
jgi:hypothetical protein